MKGGWPLSVLLLAGCASRAPEPTASKLPPWRGFNIDAKMEADNAEPYREEDFRLMASWGMDFVRLPIDYRVLDAEGLEELDRAIAWGRTYGLHVDVNLHRVPGWCINPPAEPRELWTDETAQEEAAALWASLARRYKDIPNRELSFNLLNEPDEVEDAEYVEVVKLLVAAIRTEDPRRLILVDGLDMGSRPVPQLAGLGVAQSLHAYQPWEVSLYRAPWMKRKDWPKPGWPMTVRGELWDKERLRRTLQPWRELQAKGVAVHVGEIGAFRNTPPDVARRWTADYLSLFEEYGWGWSVWCLGEFDRGLLDLLREGRR